MYEDHKGCSARYKGNGGVRPAQTVPAEQSERHRSDIAASFAKPTGAQVMPNSQFDHVCADDNNSQK
jgi:hypothetical protein